MTNTPLDAATEARDTPAWAAFDKTTARWGRITMLFGLVFSLAGPIWLVYFSGLQVDAGKVWVAFLAIAAVVGVIWVLEPFAYFPILGPAAMYQAFMIGNISNKLLPSAVAGQASIGAKTGTKRADLAAILAICGAALVHVVSLVVFVGLLGTVLLHVLPEAFLTAVSTYIFPAVLGGFVVQIIMTNRSQPRVLIVAALVSVVLFGLSLLVPALSSLATVLAVVLTATVAWLTRSKKVAAESIEDVS
ncbi:hypothetical protein FHX49_000345 [Microbacterium endophyticum]|uniref:Uncharacterized protein n=1 Tax=Microbacterium endophyticum TaxID=1526412 RepID=A0A7W4V127_9MICO|nr:hypothetical protein [Microbacterium endophyticum]MBB2974804.1 hypothetical protein [Microbacterium endophyticum]NIK37101.1 hypothetical protein [Microbacterium endophyticum]